MIGQLLVLVGSVLTLLAAIGMVRFTDVFARMHSLAKASTAGVVLVLIGAAIHLEHPNDVTSLALAALLQVITSPVAANMLSVATYHAEGIDLIVHTVDELDEHIEADDVVVEDPMVE
jgi:multicomponent Na+:H+ antiporter subunit G